MEWVLVAALAVMYLTAKWEHYRDRQDWQDKERRLLNRIQSPETALIEEQEDLEGAISYNGNESDTRGLTGDPWAPGRGSNEA